MKRFSVFSTIVFFVLIQEGKPLHYPQYLQTFMKKSCVGNSWRDFTTSKTDFDQDSASALHVSMSCRGVWRWTTADGLSGIRFSTSSGTCGTNIDPLVLRLTSVTMILPSDLDDSSLALFNGSDYTSTPVTVINQTEAEFQSPIKADSWVVTGLEGFTLFVNPKFDGNSICLQANSQAESKWGMSYGFRSNLPFSVRSVRLGCDASTRNNMLQGSNKSLSFVTDSEGNEVKGVFQDFCNSYASF